MISQLRPAFFILLVMTVLTGLIYPLAITGLAQVLFPRQSNGSLIVIGGKTYGSSLIGQQFSDPKYFWGRLSDTGDYPYNAFNAQTLTGSSGSNYGPLNPALAKAAQSRIAALQAADPGSTAPIPIDLVTASGSGLDPNISVEAAYYQIHRVARARGMTDAALQGLVDQYTQGRQLGFLGEPRVNVLELNLALDGLN